MNSLIPHKWVNRFTLLMMFVSLSLWMSPSVADEHEQVAIKAWISDADSSDREQTGLLFAPSEQIILTIELATSRWFTAGAQVHIEDQPHLIMMQRNPFGSNSTQRRNGETWSLQQLELTLYPTQSGHYQLPPIAVDVRYSVSGKSDVTRRLYTPSFSFETSLPNGQLGPQSNWFSASSVQASQLWQIQQQDPQNTQLKVGDSVTRQVSISATDSLSVFLPSMLDNFASDYYANYLAPVELSDTQERGHYQSNRIEQQTLVVTQGGEFTLPALTLQWWNTKEQRVERIELAQRHFKVKHTLSSLFKKYALSTLLVIGVLGAIATLLWLLLSHLKKRGKLDFVPYLMAIVKKDSPLARQLVYKRCLAKQHQSRLIDLQPNLSWQSQALTFQSQEQMPKRSAFSIWRAISKLKHKQAFRIFPNALKGLPKNNDQTQER